jgi:hypothetical protein
MEQSEEIAFLKSEIQRLRDDRDVWRQMVIDLMASHPTAPPSQDQQAEGDVGHHPSSCA